MSKIIKYAMALGMAAAMPLVATAGDTDNTCPATGAKAGTCPATAAAKDTCAASKCDKLAKVEYKVSGMSCAACEDKVTKAVAKLDGVSEPSACSKSGKAVMTIDSKKVKDEQLLAAIEHAGFKVEGEVLTVKVEGMKCEACSSKVSKAVTAVKGAKAEGICHESGQAVVSFDPKKVSRDQIIAAIDKSGFKVVQ